MKCAQNLWTVVRHWNLSSGPTAPDRGGLLRAWAATRFQEGKDDLVIAIHAYTYLTVVCPLTGPEETCAALRVAVADILQDLHVPAARIDIEIAAVDSVQFEWLRDPSLRSGLRDVTWFCGLERLTHSCLKTVQRNLNELPHAALGGNTPCVAALAVLRGTAANRVGPH
jgi:hypothetical protein